MTEFIVNLRAGRTEEVPAEMVLSDLAYAVQGLRRLPSMTADQHKRLFAMSCEIDSIYASIGDKK